MNIYQYAMKLEKDSENYYNKLMSKTDDVGLQTILKMLVGEEVKHFSIVEQMMKTDTCPALRKLKGKNWNLTLIYHRQISTVKPKNLKKRVISII